MARSQASVRPLILLSLTLPLTLVGCSMEEPVEEVVEEVDSGESPIVDPASLTYVPPADCTTLLPEAAVADLQSRGIQLVRGPGSPSAETIYVEGQTPEELAGGLSCLFAVPGEEDTGITIILSAAAVDQSIRPAVIDAFLDEGLNVGQTGDGQGLTYWRWGDDVNVTALHNALYQDSWYSALIQPGGRAAYDQGVVLVDQMRLNTTQ